MQQRPDELLIDPDVFDAPDLGAGPDLPPQVQMLEEETEEAAPEEDAGGSDGGGFEGMLGFLLLPLLIGLGMG